MQAAIFKGRGDIVLGERPDPVIENETDAIVRVVMGCVCGSDLWYYRGINDHKEGSIGHEFIGVVEGVGSQASDLQVGSLVIAPFKFSDGECAHCQAGFEPECIHGGGFGSGEIDGGQGQKVRVPFADTTLVTVPAGDYSDDMLASFLSLSDVMCTGYHAAVSAQVKEGDTVAVVGDGAVGLCGIIAAKLKGASRIIAFSRNPDRQELAKEFGATDILEERGDDAAKKIMELTDGVGVDAALECVGTEEAMKTATEIVRPGGFVGVVGLPTYGDINYLPIFIRNVGISGGVAPAHSYIPELLPAVIDGTINPGKVFDYRTDLSNVVEAYQAMDERRAIKSLLRVSEV